MELFRKSARELRDMMDSGDCSAVEITKAHFARIQDVEPKLQSFLTLTEESALETAKAVDTARAKGEKLPPLAGIPVAVKDNLCTEGIKTTAASKMLHNFVPPYHATVVENLHKQMAVVPGKVNMDEFAMGSSCENSYYQKTANPHDTSRVPGGSSGGSAAAVAGGEATLALGSDTGGSIRQPASFTGIVGLKPTYGTVSRYGLIAFASSLDQIGPMGRSSEDVAMLYHAIAGHDAQDATSAKFEKPAEYTGYLGRDISAMTIGVPKEFFGEGIEDEVVKSIEQAIGVYRGLGATIKEVSLPSVPHALSAYYIISSAEASSNLGRFDGVKYGYRTKEYSDLQDMYLKSRTEGFGPEVKRRIMLGTYVLSSGYFDAYYKKGINFQKTLTSEFAESFKTCDFLITPTVPHTAFKLGEKVDDPVTMYKSDICTVPINIAGLPSMSLPCGMGAGNLPIGMQLIGPKFGEDILLSAGQAFENESGITAIVPEVK